MSARHQMPSTEPMDAGLRRTLARRFDLPAKRPTTTLFQRMQAMARMAGRSVELVIVDEIDRYPDAPVILDLPTVSKRKRRRQAGKRR